MRHLLPDEIDQMVDGDAGFGVAPLRAHLAECAECTARVSGLTAVTDALDALPYHAPRIDFADNVLNRVQIIEPWYVALADTARGFIPRAQPMRALAAVGAGLGAVAVSGGAMWLSFQTGLAAWVFNVALDQGRENLLVGAGNVAGDVLGAGGAATLAQGGLPMLAIGAAVLAGSAIAAAAGFRRLASAARAKRS